MNPVTFSNVVCIIMCNVITGTPSLKLINRYVITDHAVRWEQIGRILKVKGLENIRANYRQSANFFEDCLRVTLSKWLQIDTNASWNKLKEALNQAIDDEAGTGGENVRGMLLLLSDLYSQQ